MNIDDLRSQVVNSVQAQTQPQINEFFDSLNSQLQLFVTIGIIIAVLWGLLLIGTLVFRWRSHAAIMRIDKNLQKLVASQPEPKSPKAE